MTGWAITFLIVALVCATLGFGGVAGIAADCAQVLTGLALITAATCGIVAAIRRRRNPPAG